MSQHHINAVGPSSGRTWYLLVPMLWSFVLPREGKTPRVFTSLPRVLTGARVVSHGLDAQSGSGGLHGNALGSRKIERPQSLVATEVSSGYCPVLRSWGVRGVGAALLREQPQGYGQKDGRPGTGISTRSTCDAYRTV